MKTYVSTDNAPIYKVLMNASVRLATSQPRTKRVV